MKKRQVVFIMVDSQRADMLGCYGNKDMITPNLDKLAEQGVRYNKAQSCQPVCGPARSTIFSGLYPHQTSVFANCMPLGDNVKTIGQRLTDNGFHCGYIGKWHLDGADYFGNTFCPEGFDEKYWYDMRMYLEELTDEQRLRSRQIETSLDPDWTKELTYAHRCSDRAMEFLDNHSEEDFYLAVSYDEPHNPFIAPAPYNTMYEGYKMPHSENYEDDLNTKTLMQRLWADNLMGLKEEELNSPRRDLMLYLGCNTFVDMEIGRVLDKIYAKCPDALIIYTSDHGEMLNNHQLILKNSCMYKEIVNIPFIVKGMGQGVNDNPASHVDIVPTILDYMGLNIPKLLPGKSMLPELKGECEKTNEVVFTEFTRTENNLDTQCGFQPMRGAYDGRYKLAINLMDVDELYDTLNDPDEVNNLINDESLNEIKFKLHDDILKLMDDTRDVFRGYHWATRPWRPDKKPSRDNSKCVRQRENEEYEPRQLNYETGLPMETAVRPVTKLH